MTKTSKKTPDELTNLDLHEDLTAEIVQIPAEAEFTGQQVADEINEKRASTEEIPRQAVVLTGGIDSTVMLYMIEETMKSRFDKFKIYPVVLYSQNQKEDENQTRYIKTHLSRLGIKEDIKTFTLGSKSESIEQVLQWCEANDIGVIAFAANGKESEANIPGKNFADYQVMNTLSDYVQVYTPLITQDKKTIVKWAVDKYNIDLTETVPPYFPKNALGDLNRTLRQEAFKGAWSDRIGKWIVDPYDEQGKDKIKTVESAKPKPAVKTNLKPKG